MCLAPQEKLELKDKSLKPTKKVSFSIEVRQEEKGADTVYDKQPVHKIDNIKPITITKNENENTNIPDKVLPICFMLQEYKIHLDKSREYILELNKQLTELKQKLLESQQRERELNAKLNNILTTSFFTSQSTLPIHNNLINNLRCNKDIISTNV